MQGAPVRYTFYVGSCSIFAYSLIMVSNYYYQKNVIKILKFKYVFVLRSFVMVQQGQGGYTFYVGSRSDFAYSLFMVSNYYY